MDKEDTGRGIPEPTRRERLRTATVTEIKSHAWAQVAEGGALGVSLRAISRSMGMTSSALYRYFDSHEQLLSELIGDGYASLADALEVAEAAFEPGESSAERFLDLASAHRRWALEHATAYALIFGTRMCDPKADDRVLAEHKRGVAVLFRAMIACIQSGGLDPSRLPAPAPALRRQLKEWEAHLGLPLGPDALAGCMFVWAQLHGAISLEVFGQLPEQLEPAEALFELQMRAALAAIGSRDALGS